MTHLQNQRNVTLSHVCVSMQSVQYCNSHLSHMDIFSGSNLVQQRAQTSPSSPTTSSSSLSSCVGAVHTCAGTCSHGPYGGYRTCLRIKNCCKCKSTRTYSCNSVPDPLHMGKRGTKSEDKTYARGHHDAPRNKAWIQRLSRFPQ